MKIKDITFAVKRGQPNYGSISAGMTVEVHEGENLEQVWDFVRQECDKQCTIDASFINTKQPNEGGDK